MPDTGAPWNIPYVAGTDLVRDWPTDSQELAEAIADGLDEAGNAGIGSNVVQTVKTDTFSTTSTSFTTVTGLTATITPTSNTSKVLLIANLMAGHTQSVGGYAFKFGGGNTSSFVGDAASNRTRAVFSLENADAVSDHVRLLAQTMVYLDSPSTTSATTYSVECLQINAGTLYVNRTGLDTDNSGFTRGASSITAIEVAA